MPHPHVPVRYRRSGTGRSPQGGPRPGSRFVLVGQKDFYDWTNPDDRAEYRTVISYTTR